jgi:hypothetical protein
MYCRYLIQLIIFYKHIKFIMVLNIIQIIFLFHKIFINLNLLVNHILLIDLNRNIY